MENLDLNHNFQDCFKAISHIGGTTYQNICDNTVAFVPWGAVDWLLLVFVVGFILSTITLIIHLFRN